MNSRRQHKADPDAAPMMSRHWQAVYLLLTVAMAMMLPTQLFPGGEIRIALTLVMITLMGLTVKGWTGAILLIMIQVHLFDPEFRFPPSQAPFASIVSFIISLMWVFWSLLLLLVVSRYRVLQDLEPRSDVSYRGRLAALASGLSPQESVQFVTSIKRLMGPLFRAILLLACCAAVASLLMSLIPLNMEMQTLTIRDYRLKPAGYRAIMLGLLLFVAFLILWIVVNELVWRSLSRQQASVYIRSTFMSWMHRDLRMIVRKRLKRKRAKARKTESTSHDTADFEDPKSFDGKG